MRRPVTWFPANPATLLAAVLVAVPAALAMAADVRAQTLDLDGVRAGPAIPAENAAVELARALDAEKGAIDLTAGRLAAEAKHGAEAKSRLRLLAILMLQQGAQRPWSESAPAVLGLRLANAMSRLDRLIDAATEGRRADDGKPIPAADLRAVHEAVRRLSHAPLEDVRNALSSDGAPPAELTRALSKVLAPLGTLVELVEGARIGDPWPVSTSTAQAGRSAPDSIAATPQRVADIAALSAMIEALPADAARASARAILAVATDDPIADDELLRGLGAMCDALGWARSLRTATRVPPIDPVAIDAIERRTGAMLERLAAAVTATPMASDVRDAALAQADALAPSVEAARAMLAMRERDWATDTLQRSLAEACASLCAAELAGDAAERSRMRIAERIVEACRAAERLARLETVGAPRDLRDVARMLDRDARIAVQALPPAFAAMAGDPSRSADPAALSTLARVVTLEADRARLDQLQALIDRVGGVQPKAGRGFAGVARRLARMLLDPIKRAEAQVAFNAVESQAAAVLPFPFEEELLRETPRAAALTGGNARRVAEIAAAMRVAWAEELGRGAIGGPAAQTVSLAARYCAALRDVAQLSAPITREEGDRLATWGGWGARRALLAPAAVDLDARAVLASRSLVAMGPKGDPAGFATDFARDLGSIEQELPLVRLAARLERTLGTVLDADPDSVAAMIAPVVKAPRPDAALARDWGRLLTLNRVLLEAEFARRTGNLAYRAALAEYGAGLAGDIETSAFGAPPVVAAVPGFDGAAESEPRDEPRRPADRPRSR